MADDFDLEALVTLEQTFYDEGYKDGFAHGRIHGIIEGRALGREKGFEMWEELGFYEGFALMWKAMLTQKRPDDRALHHIKLLLDLIVQFPRVNPSSISSSPPAPGSGAVSTTADPQMDVPKLFRQIRSRYKVLCSALGVRPSLRAADGTPADNIETGDENLKVGGGTHNTNPTTAIKLLSSSTPTRAEAIWHVEDNGSTANVINVDPRSSATRPALDF